jgi:peptidoglycan hydrolase-like protein with peptidoglycan-binding domain
VKIVTRSALGWPATPARTAHPSLGLVIHYDGSDQGLAGRPHAACLAYWRRTRSFHMGPARDWADIGYSWGACPHGVILEGRGLGHEQAAQPGGNTSWYSVTLMSGPSEKPTPEQVDAIRQLRAWLMGKGVGGQVRGHRNFYSTSCPGDVLYELVRDGTFTGTAASATTWTETLMKDLPLLKKGAATYDVKSVRALLFARGYVPLAVYELHGLRAWLEVTTFDMELEQLMRDFQREEELTADGQVGPRTWAALLRRG